MIEMQYVQSGNVESIGYDADAAELHVKFLSGPTVYIYEGVPSVVFEQMLLAPSKGTFLNQSVKATFPFRRT